MTPDIVCLAKAMGGGLPCGAIGATAEVMAIVEDDTYEQVGTFNGNPLTMAAAKATLLEVLTPEAYAHIEHLRDRMAEGSEEILARHGIEGYVSAFGAKGAVIFSADRLNDYRDFWATTAATATSTGSTSTTVACSSRRGASASSGRCRSSTPTRTWTSSWPTWRRSPPL